MTRYDVQPDVMGDHARTVGTYSSRLDTAASAAETTLDNSAFGLVNTFLAVAATGLAGIAQDAITSSSKDMTETMTTLRQAVKQYGSDDLSGRDNVNKAGGK